jgi:hypothetical protein
MDFFTYNIMLKTFVIIVILIDIVSFSDVGLFVICNLFSVFVFITLNFYLLNYSKCC